MADAVTLLLNGTPQGDTDSELKRRWDMLQRKISSLRENQLPAGPDREQVNRDIDKERETIEYLWENNLLRRSHGKLTDRSAMDTARKTITDLAKIRGFQIRFTGETEYLALPTCWRLSIMYMGQRSQLIMRGWTKLIEDITTELAEAGNIVGQLSEQDWHCDEAEIPDDYYVRDYSKPGAPFYSDEDDDDEDEDEEFEMDSEDVINNEEPRYEAKFRVESDPYLRPTAAWVIKTWVWDGPPKQRGRRK